MSDNARLRRQIGFFKKQIQRFCSDAAQTLKDYNISLPNPQLGTLGDDELETFRLEVTSIRSSLLKSYTKITKLDEEWTTLQKSNSDEQQVFDEYLRKYGDYRIVIVDAVKNLEDLDSLLSIVDQEYGKRHLTLSSVSSEPNTPDEESGWNRENRPLLQNTSQIPITSRLTDPSLMNFVDASILSKLELPTFDGNLLDYPEFSSRFATLVGNKVQLDDTTKFSLLKSCLRGKALHVIQGLSMTPGNYKVAMDILRTHFDDKVTLKHILYTKLASLPACDPEGRNLLSLYNQMFSLVRQFSNGTDDSKERALGALLLNKLPARVKSQIYDETQHDHNVSPLELLHLLTNIVRKESTLSEMEYYSRSSSNPRFQQGSYLAAKRPQSQPSSANAKPKQHCPFCDSRNHTATNCTTYVTAKQRSEQVRKRRLCYNCLSTRHNTKECTSKFRCRICSRKHHTSLCTSARSKSAPPNIPKSPIPQDDHHPRLPTLSPARKHAVHFDVTHMSCDDNQPISEDEPVDSSTMVPHENRNNITFTTTEATSPPAPLMCTDVKLFNPDDPACCATVTAFLDCGSTATYITEKLAALLDLSTIQREELSVSTFAGSKPISMECSIHKIGIVTENGTKCLTVKSTPSLAEDVMQIIPDGKLSVTSCKPSILIGNDYFWDLVLSHKFYYRSLSEGHRLLHTTIGDIILKKALDTKSKDCSFVSVENDDVANPAHHNELCELVSRFWKLESIGILDNPDQHDDDECLRYFNNTIYYDSDEKRYVVTLPFKIDPTRVPDNYTLAYSRLRNQLKHLQQNPSYLEKYHAVIEDQLQRRIIEPVPAQDLQKPCHYLSHHGVMKKNDKDLKIRCVYDGSAKMKGSLSLNDTLHRGPVLLPNLVGILIRSRLYDILISSDIEKAFLMVGLNQVSRDYTRFLWLKNPTHSLCPQNLITYRFTRVPFGLVCSPFLLAGTIHFHLSTTATDISQHIIRNTYVDNVFYGVKNIDDGITFYKESKSLFQEAGMNLRAYASNSTKLNEYFQQEEKENISKIQKLLGLEWDIVNDHIIVPFPKTPKEKTIWTKRKILKHIASIYDPLGLFSPAALPGKLFLQSLWKEKLIWDDTLPLERTAQWEKILATWSVAGISTPRLIIDHQKGVNYDYDIHVFADASSAAYCAVGYLVQRIKNSPVGASLIMSKSRLAPLNHSMTIPRLEIAALMIASKLLTYLTKELDVHISKKYLWTDSTVALYWTKNNKGLPIFVKNRVSTILENTSDVSILHIPTENNPADIGTRGCSIEELMNEDSWWNGPVFLLESQEKWPRNAKDALQETQPNPKQGESVLYTHSIVSHTSKVNNSNKTIPGKQASIPLDVSRFSSWSRLLLTMMFVLKFLTKKSKQAAKLFGDTKVDLMRKSEILLFRMAQMPYEPSNETKKPLRLFMCEKTLLWKCLGRIQNANLPSESITPIFLPRESRITTLYILHAHQIHNHCGINHTLTLLRERVWIPKGRATVKRTLHNDCFHCKRFYSKPYTLPPFPPHPERRVTPPQYPFENVGMDFFGPMLYKTNENVTEKYWMLMFTCLNCRAIYVDVVLDMTTATVLHVLRRFIASVGCPEWIICDNAQTFKAINQCYSSLPTPEIDEDIIDYCTTRRIRMKFIPSLSPWQGGVYEKMIDIFKKSYKHAIANRLLDIEEIRTVAKETEAIVNTRPLTYFSDEVSFQPLRPIDFIRPHTRLSGLYPTENLDQWLPYQTTRDTLLMDWNRTSNLVSNFWTRWSKEYLTAMREQYKTDHALPRSHERGPPKYGDIVLIHDSTLDRGQWKMGRIIGSQDSYQRSAQIQLPSNRIITRPNSLIHKLEIPLHKEDSQITKNTIPPTRALQPPRHPMVTRSRARAQAHLASLLCLLSVLHLTNTFSMRCPDESITPRTILYATTCRSRGIAVAKYKDGFCHFPISCPNGHIRFEILFAKQPYSPPTLCGKKCKCPDWSSQCSFHTGSRTAKSELQLIPTPLLHYRPNFVCSFKPDSNCDTTKRLGTFNQVQLYDDNLLLVENLTVTLKDYLTQGDFLCIDRKGWKRLASTGTHITGTPWFCKRQKCQEPGEIFCLYDNPIALLLTNTSLEKNSIPIKAWGPITKIYYGFPPSPKSTTPSVVHVSNRSYNYSITASSCSKGGITIAESDSEETVEACIEQYCVFRKVFTSSHIPFPNTLTMYDYKVSIRVWVQGKLVFENQLFCPAQPICETMQCLLCWERVYNTQCWTYPQIIVLALLLLITPLWIYTVIKILCLFLRLIKRLLYHLCLVDKLLSFLKGRRKPQIYINPRRKRHKQGLLTCLTLLCLLVQYGFGCSQITSITASESICFKNQERETCTFNEATIITLQPLQQESCLLLKNYRNEPIGLLSINVDGIDFKCQKDVQFYTRDHHIFSESIHRCYLAGSCIENACENTSPTTKFEEISNLANRSPGYTFCTSSCGCIACDGCFMCQPSCLFYRVYARPTSRAIYTVFKCPSWETIVTAKVTLDMNNETFSTKLLFRPGQIIKWKNLKFSLTSTNVPQLPILSSTFMEMNGKISIVQPAHKGQLNPRSAGQLQCSSLQKAKNFNCVFAMRTCSCSTTLKKASCTCGSGNMAKLMNASRLPLSSKNFMIYPKRNTLYAKSGLGSTLQLHVVANNLKITSQQTNTSCETIASDAEGCYDCITGAEITFLCKSKSGSTLASIACAEENQIAQCTTKGYVNKLRFHFNTSEISMDCKVTCPANVQAIRIQGHLQYIEDDSIAADTMAKTLSKKTPRDISFLSTLPGIVFHQIENFINFISHPFKFICFVIFLLIFLYLLHLYIGLYYYRRHYRYKQI